MRLVVGAATGLRRTTVVDGLGSGRRIGYSSALETKRGGDGLGVFGRPGGGSPSDVFTGPAATSPSATGKKGRHQSTLSARFILLTNSEDWSIQFPGMTSQATGSSGTKETHAR
jgi:hypothetical protein